MLPNKSKGATPPWATGGVLERAACEEGNGGGRALDEHCAPQVRVCGRAELPVNQGLRIWIECDFHSTVTRRRSHATGQPVIRT